VPHFPGADLNTLRQIAAVTVLNLKSLPARMWPSLVIVVGMASVVGVLLSMLSFEVGYVHAFLGAGDPGRAIVLAGSAQNEFGSALERDVFPIIKDAPGIKRDAEGAAVADAEIYATVPAFKKNGEVATVLVRGVGPKAIELRPEFKLVSGRMFRPGSRELIVGIGAEAQYASLAVGDKVLLPDGEWPIVGSYSTGDVVEGELVSDTDTIMSAIKHATYNSVIVRLSSPDALDAFKKALTTNPALSVSVERHSDYYRRTSQTFAGFVAGVAYAVGAILAFGAFFGALNTMYSAVAARTIEIATLRAIGFGAAPLAISVISEALLLALIGALIGAAAAWLLFNGQQHISGNNVFHLEVSPGLIGLGIAWAAVTALLGAALPAIHAAKLPVAAALRRT
jgi:putative ABC transport system permease protein